jgi:hypothetical protein
MDTLNNRLAGIWESGLGGNPALRGFTANPLGPVPAWQAEIYQAAFLQAQKDARETPKEFPWAESWN